MSPEEHLNIREITLEQIKIGLTQRLSNHLFNVSVDLSEQDSFIYNAIDLQVRGFIWGEQGKPTTIKYPKTWREAFKERWFPEWLLRRYPVVYQVHEISLKTLYPDFRISLPRETHVLKYAIAERTERWD